MYSRIFVLTALLLTFLSFGTSSYGQFSVDAYKQFLQSNQNMSAEQLLNLYPAGTFESNINKHADTHLYFDSIDHHYNLTEYEKSLINKNGFMVSERLQKTSFGEALLDIYHKDLPVFISTDAILHAFHISYDRILRDMELAVLIDNLNDILINLRSSMPQLQNRYSSQPEMDRMLYDADVYLTVAAKLLGNSVEPYFASNNEKINYLFDKAMDADGFSEDTIFADKGVKIDWSQFKPRGHYDDNQLPQLSNYFRAMVWLGRIEIYLLAPEGVYLDENQQRFADLQRQSITAYLIKELFDISDQWQMYNDFEEIIGFFVGDQDNVTLSNLKYLSEQLLLSSADELLDSLRLVEFQDTLSNQSFVDQKILSQILVSGNSMTPDSIKPASAFLLFGQRFVIDSYVTGSVVYDRIFYNGQKICRLFPSTLDPMFAMGNDAAAQLLKPELEQYKYASNLTALRYLIDSYGDNFWESTIYNMWLNSIRKLNPPLERNDLPEFMQTAAFWQQKLNTQLSSWSQLRHDNLLYAKQSYTGGSICSFPHTYIEPFPEMYEKLKQFASLSAAKFQLLPFKVDYLKYYILSYLQTFEPIMEKLQITSQKILDGITFTAEEDTFLHKVIYNQYFGSGPQFDGWYTQLFYRDHEFSDEGLLQKDHIVADIHTTPSDCVGNYNGWITHVGTGPINLGVFLAEVPGGESVAFVGPVLSYYEYVTENFLRLTDDEWDNEHLQSALRPAWVNTYLADNTGSSRGDGPSLITSIEIDADNPAIVEDHLIIKNYPNPFNPETIISFSIPSSLTNSHVELLIYNINGQLIKRVIDEVLPAGNYLTKWNGTDQNNRNVSSGIYIYQIKAGGSFASGKMTLLK
jgi:hypothetical protein